MDSIIKLKKKIRPGGGIFCHLPGTFRLKTNNNKINL